MTKLYDALREAGAAGLKRKDSSVAPATAPSTDHPAEAAHAPAAAGASDPARDLEAIRGIIFGKLFEDYEKLMKRLEESLVGEAARLRSELGELDRKLADRVEQIEARNVKAHSDLREQLLSQSNLLKDAIAERNEHLTKKLDDGLDQLRQSKIDRSAFASFLGGLASHIGELRATSGIEEQPKSA